MSEIIGLCVKLFAGVADNEKEESQCCIRTDYLKFILLVKFFVVLCCFICASIYR